MKNHENRSPSQKGMYLDISIKNEGEFDGIEMGVLENGIPYLTQNGLSIACGVQRLRIKEISDEWTKSFEHGIFKKGKMTFIGSYLQKSGYVEPKLYIPIMKNNVEYHPKAIDDSVLDSISYSQAGSVRHKDAFTAYNDGYKFALSLAKVA